MLILGFKLCWDFQTKTRQIFLEAIFIMGISKTFWYRKARMKSLYSSKVFENIADFSCMILPDETVEIFWDQNVSIFLIRYMYNGNISTFLYRKFCVKVWYNSHIFENIVDFWSMSFWTKTVSIPLTYIPLKGIRLRFSNAGRDSV